MSQEFQKSENGNTAAYETSAGDSVTVKTDEESFNSLGLGHLHYQVGKNFALPNSPLQMIKILGIASKFGDADESGPQNPNLALWILHDGEVMYLDQKAIDEMGLKASS